MLVTGPRRGDDPDAWRGPHRTLPVRGGKHLHQDGHWETRILTVRINDIKTNISMKTDVERNEHRTKKRSRRRKKWVSINDKGKVG